MTVAAWWLLPSQAMAVDLTVPSAVVDAYLSSLVAGDTTQINALIDGRMKEQNRHLTVNPQAYSQSLRNNYAGVQFTVESVVPEGDAVRARVRFDYPAPDSAIIEFILTETGGQWKITDERF